MFWVPQVNIHQILRYCTTRSTSKYISDDLSSKLTRKKQQFLQSELFRFFNVVIHSHRSYQMMCIVYPQWYNNRYALQKINALDTFYALSAKSVKDWDHFSLALFCMGLNHLLFFFHIRWNVILFPTVIYQKIGATGQQRKHIDLK